MTIAVFDIRKQKTIEIAFGDEVMRFEIPESNCTFCKREARWFVPGIPTLFLCEFCERKSGYRNRE